MILEIYSFSIVFSSLFWQFIKETLQQRNYPEALRYRKLLAEEKERIINEERVAQLAEMEARFQSEKKQNEILVLMQQTDINNLIISEQKLQIQRRNQIIAFVGLLTLLTAEII